ncbi:MAG TPA: hypothetical protein VFD77_03565 [Brumimicrobium sp.]|nr:hypothetical protein [Brumimicrobium sp.]
MKKKILVSILFIRNLILENHSAFKVLKLLVFVLSILTLYFLFFPNILYWAFDSPTDFGRIPMKVKASALNVITFLFIFLWMFQIGLFCIRSFVLYFMHSIFGTWKWKGFLFIWEQTTTMIFLTISIIGYSFLWGWSYGNVSGIFQNRGVFLNHINLFMNEHETLVFYTSNLSLIVFILSFIHNLWVKWMFKHLDEWKRTVKKLG